MKLVTQNLHNILYKVRNQSVKSKRRGTHLPENCFYNLHSFISFFVLVRYRTWFPKPTDKYTVTFGNF